MKVILMTVGVLCAVAVVVIAQTPMRPGRWEATMQMQMPQAPVQLPEMKTTQCITPEQLKDPVNAVPQGPTANQDCKVSDYKVSGNTVTWQMACTKPQAITSTGEMIFEGDTYAGTMKVTTPQGDMSMKLVGKRLGDCTP